jgi:ABC-type phosphate transport system substrate-binding protein
MSRKARAMLALGTLGTTAALIATIQPAWADPQARPTDAVAVGSDTVQNAADFLFNGDTLGHPSYNQGKSNTVYNFFATGDGNGRALYNSSGQLLYGNGTTSAVLRAGTKPVERPDGSGAGISALVADSLGSTGYQGLPLGSLTFIRASRLPKAAEQTSCAGVSGCGGLHVFQFATDNLEIATSGGTGPATDAFPLSETQLAFIYSHCDASGGTVGGPTAGSQGVTWSQVPGAPASPAAPNAHIIAVIPQSGSGTRNFFEGDIGVSDATIASSTCLRVSEEHDPTGITQSATPADAIEPFSVGKIKVIQSGYFNNSQEASSDFQIALIPGCASPATDQTPNCGTAGTTQNLSSDGNPVYDATRGLYFIARDFDLGLTLGTGAVCGSGGSNPNYGQCKPSQPGGTKNWVQDLLSGATSWIARGTNAGDITSAGFTANYQDLGDASSG